MTLTTEQLRAEMIEKIAVASGLRARDGRNVVAAEIYAEVVEPLLTANREAQPVAWEMRYWSDGYNILGDWERISEELYTRLSAEHAADNDYEFRVLYDAPPVPAVLEAIITAPIEAMRCGPAASYVLGWNACRAAMLAQPVSGGYKLPDGWIACSEQMPAVGEHDWRTALPVLVKCEIGVIPAYYGFTYHEGEQCFGFMESVKFGDASGSGPEQHENRLMMHVTHWMPLPPAPEGGNC